VKSCTNFLCRKAQRRRKKGSAGKIEKEQHRGERKRGQHVRSPHEILLPIKEEKHGLLIRNSIAVRGEEKGSAEATPLTTIFGRKGGVVIAARMGDDIWYDFFKKKRRGGRECLASKSWLILALPSFSTSVKKGGGSRMTNFFAVDAPFHSS